MRDIENTEGILLKRANGDALLFLKQCQYGTCLRFEIGQTIKLGIKAIELGSDLSKLLLQVLLLIREIVEYSLELLLDLSIRVGDNLHQAILHRV